MHDELEHLASLDDVVVRIADTKVRPDLGVLSSSELLYVALASNSKKLLDQSGHTMVQAFERLGPSWREHLLGKWQFTSSAVLRKD